MKPLKNVAGSKMISKNEQKQINGGIVDNLKCSEAYPECPPGYGCVWRTGRCVWGA